MGLFGYIKDEKAVKIIQENIDLIKMYTEQGIDEVGRSLGSVQEKTSGSQIIRGRIKAAVSEIRDYIASEPFDAPAEYPYGKAYVFVACAIINKYVKIKLNSAQ